MAKNSHKSCLVPTKVLQILCICQLLDAYPALPLAGEGLGLGLRDVSFLLDLPRDGLGGGSGASSCCVLTLRLVDRLSTVASSV